mgnify:CR=1 FL=1
MADEKKDIISEHTSGMTPGEAAGLREKIKGMEPEELEGFRESFDPDSMGFYGEESV